MNSSGLQSKQLQRRSIEQEVEYLANIASHSQFAATLQTSLQTRNVGKKRMEQLTDQARRSLHQLRMRFNRATTGDRCRTNPNLTPIFIASLEGSLNTYDRNRTLHFHAVIGNLQEEFDLARVEHVLREIWPATDYGVDDIVVKPLTDERRRGWTDYISKERMQGNFDCVDYHNAQLPQYLCVDRSR